MEGNEGGMQGCSLNGEKNWARKKEKSKREIVSNENVQELICYLYWKL